MQTGRPSPEQRLRAALLQAGAGACLTGDAALALYGVRAAPRLEGVRAVDVLVPHDRHPCGSGFVRIHRTRRPCRALPVRGLPCAPLVRAALEAVPYRDRESEVVALLTELVQARSVTPEELMAEVRDSALGKVPGVGAAMEGLIAGVRSVAEEEARRILRTAGIPDPLWNRDLRLPDGTWLARPDAYWPSEGVVLEIDSRRWHLGPADWEATMARRNRMLEAGLLALAFSPYQLRTSPVKFAQSVRTALATGRSRPAPLLRWTQPTS
ncbi:hypothetical protein [Streptomyces sp. NBC_01465]|uniref:hypothetical protein n=1 Tax=Streptomyces sp. NBC_01465 TaxID=2903878 RepID=UPI002E338052|nr:hypothetical protein [Streptomyces sp. NBC_01465]